MIDKYIDGMILKFDILRSTSMRGLALQPNYVLSICAQKVGVVPNQKCLKLKRLNFKFV